MSIINPIFEILDTCLGFFNILLTVFNLMPPGLGILILFGLALFVINFVLDFIS